MRSVQSSFADSSILSENEGARRRAWITSVAACTCALAISSRGVAQTPTANGHDIFHNEDYANKCSVRCLQAANVYKRSVIASMTFAEDRMSFEVTSHGTTPPDGPSVLLTLFLLPATWTRRLATSRQGLGRRRTFGRVNKQLGQLNVQRFGDAFEKINRRILRLALKSPHIRAVNPRFLSQFLLRNTSVYADSTHIPGHNRTSFHAQSMS